MAARIRSLSLAIPLLVALNSARASGPAGAPDAPTWAVTDAIEAVSPAVVNVAIRLAPRSHPGGPWPFFSLFSRADELPARRGIGSGLILEASGLVLTAEHLVDRATQIDVSLASGRRYRGAVKTADRVSDIALIQLDIPSPLSGAAVARFGNSDDLRVGESVVAIGCPFALERSVTRGVVSGLGRRLAVGPRRYRNLIQTDALINPGSSGGPLVNLRGEVVGINVAVVTSGRGIGFALPINRARRIADELAATGAFHPSWLGARVAPLSPEDADRAGLAEACGVVVREVAADGPAARAGVTEGDIILQVNGRGVSSPDELEDRIESLPAGRIAALMVARDARMKVVEVTVAVSP